MRWLRRFVSLPAVERGLLLRAAFVVGAIRLALWLLPFRRVLHAVLGLERSGRLATSRPTVGRLVWAIQVASRFVPVATCLTQALALQWLLMRSGHASRIHIGVKKGAGARFEAHAWVECNDQIVIGAPQAHDYLPLAAWKGAL